MEYIHKAKAEKTRTKVLTDQMEARRVKNKVRIFKCLSMYFLKFFSGCAWPSCCSYIGEETGNYRRRARNSERVNGFILIIALCMPCHAMLSCTQQYIHMLASQDMSFLLRQSWFAFRWTIYWTIKKFCKIISWAWDASVTSALRIIMRLPSRW